jgi:hypothetical protein
MHTRRQFGVAVLGVAALALLLAGTGRADAGFKMMLSDSLDGASVTIADNGLGDLNPALGVITFSGTVGEFAINVTSGLSKPVLGSLSLPQMDLNSLDTKLAGSAADTLTIKLTDTDFVPFSGLGTLTTTAGGTLAGSVTSMKVQAFLDPTNTEFGTPGPGAQLTFSTSPFAGSNSVGFGPLAAPYSLTMVETITAGAGAGSISFDNHLFVTNAPEPASLTLLGLGALGLLGYGWRKRRQAAEA